MTIKTRFPSIEPSLDLNFAATKRLDPRITFTRASSATFVNEDGLIEAAGVNQARFDHTPTTGESLGLLVEEARTNLSLQSEDFSNIYWVKTDCTITSNESTAPNGTLTADLWTNTSTPGSIISGNILKDATARTYTGSLWVKGDSTAFTLTIDFGGTANRGRAIFNLSNGTLSTILNEGNFTNTSGTITAYVNGWYRLTITTTTSTATTIRFRPFFSTTGATVRIWGAQVEEGAFPTSYIPTVAATVTRAADVASITGSNFSSWYRQDEGTFLGAGKSNDPSNNVPFLMTVDDGTLANEIAMARRVGSLLATGSMFTLGVSQADMFSSAWNTGAEGALALGLSLNNCAISFNGQSPVVDTSATLPAVTTFRLGRRSNTFNTWNGTIRRLTFWPARLGNEVLQRITQP